MQQSENIRGAIYMCLSMIGFVFNDAVIKYASTDIGMYQSIFIRGCFAVIIIGAACIHSGVFKKIQINQIINLFFGGPLQKYLPQLHFSQHYFIFQLQI